MSNVGKSSLINMLFDNKNLAKISKKPGKTKLINHFIINNKILLADLPGYGYAKLSKFESKKINLIESGFTKVSEMYYFTYAIINELDVNNVKDAIKPHRALLLKIRWGF